jgi:hypothetical protein
LCDPHINDSLINLKKCSSVQFSSHLLTRWLNSTSVKYSAQIQHEYKKTKHKIKQQYKWTTDMTASHLNRSHHFTLRYTSNADSATTNSSHDKHQLHINTHKTYHRVKNTAEWQENTDLYLNCVTTTTNAHAPNMFYRTLLISNMFRQHLRSSSG